MSLLAHFSNQGALDLVAHGKLTPEAVKSSLISILTPHFRHPAVVDKLALVLAPEAANIRAIDSDVFARDLYRKVTAEYRNAEAMDPNGCYKGCCDWERKIQDGVAEYWSALNLAVDLDRLDIRDFKFEIFKTIAVLIEAVIQPLIRELLVEARVAACAKKPDHIQHVDLGFVVEELIRDYGYERYFSPKPWNVKLNQWRNIAQHFSTRVEDGTIVGVYGKGKRLREIRLTREELFTAALRIYSISRALKTARTIFVIDNLEKVGLDTSKVELRDEQKLLHLEASFATQGFALSQFRIMDEVVEVTVRELMNLPSQQRMIHASQFAYPVWCEFPKSTLRISYCDSDGILLLTATANATDCEEVAAGTAQFESLAGKVKFAVTDAGRSALLSVASVSAASHPSS